MVKRGTGITASLCKRRLGAAAGLLLSIVYLTGVAFADAPAAPVGPDYFGAPTYYSSTSVSLNQARATRPTIFDVNADGKNDLVTLDSGNSVTHNLSVRYGSGAGNFSAPVGASIPWAANYRLADLNSDGVPDLIAITDPGFANASTVIEVRLGIVNGLFPDPPSQTFMIPVDVRSEIYVTDLTDNGSEDFIVSGTDASDGFIYSFSNNGQGSFAVEQPIALPQGGTVGQLGDFTGDGIEDVLVQTWSGDSGAIWTGQANGTFSAAPTRSVALMGGDYPVAAGDFNGDGKLDLAWHSNAPQYSGFSTVGMRVYINQGGGVFTGPTAEIRSPAIAVPYRLVPADLNSDGSLDLLALASGGPAVYINDGTGHMTGVQRVTGATSYETAVGNLNADNVPDLLTGGFAAQTSVPAQIAVYFNLNPTGDVIAPEITGTPDRQPAANGWYDNDVTITWVATDPAPSSGAPTQPTPTVASLEGEHTYTSAPSCDPAGNCATGSVTLKIDKSAPAITPTLSQQPNTNGWNNGDVTVIFNCADAGGIESCTAPVTVTAEGQTTVTGTAVDKSGKTTSIEVPVRIDKTKPTITFTAVAANNGWSNNATAVTYQCVNEDGTASEHQAPIVPGSDGQLSATGSCTDAAGNTTSQTIPVQVDATEPDLDYVISQPVNHLGWSRGPVTVTFQCDDPVGAGGSTGVSGIEFCTDPITVTAEGTSVVTGVARDRAGNRTEVNVFVNIDSVAPTLDYSVSPDQPASGWYAGNVTITFSCADATSGVATCPQAVTVSTDGAQTIHAEATDVAGNVQPVDVPINRDAAAPTIGYAITPTPNAAGWNNTAATVTFDCTDATSGIAFCTEPQTISGNGAYIVTGSAVDNAGNRTDINVTVGVDTEMPTIVPTFSPAGPNANGWYNTDVAVSYSCSDEVSDVATCSGPVTVSGEGDNLPYSGTVTDNAGNTATAAGVVRIDRTAPLAGVGVWSLPEGVKPVSGAITLTVPYAENLSGLQAAEYFIGDIDPGQGNGAAMNVAGANAAVAFGTDFPVGTYRISVRALDYAGNWSVTTTVTLVVTDPSAPRLTGNTKKNDFVPSTARGDVLPGLTPVSTDDASVGYTVMNGVNGLVSSASSFKFAYNTGAQCNGSEHNPHCTPFVLESTAFSWYVAYGSTGEFQGTGTLNTAGTYSTVTFRVVATDGGAGTDSLSVRIYPAGANTDTTAPLYRATATGLFKNTVKFN